METTITATELSRSLSDILSRVRYRGERFMIQRNGDIVATLVPVEQPKRMTFRELAELMEKLPWPLEGFADDLEEIQASQPRIGEPPKWDK